MLESCGDVIALDKSEPKLSPSFTDRVILAHRSRMIPRRRHWSKVALLVGSPMAAAASIVLAFILITPSPKETPVPVIAPITVAAPEAAREKLMQLSGTHLSPEAEAELQQTPEMKAVNLVEAMLDPVVAQSRKSWNTTRRSVEEFQAFMRQHWSNANEQLASQQRENSTEMPID